jgi:hypothetical protein
MTEAEKKDFCKEHSQYSAIFHLVIDSEVSKDTYPESYFTSYYAAYYVCIDHDYLIGTNPKTP